MVLNVLQKRGPRGLVAVCMNCRYWRPSPHYSYAGYCILLRKVTLEDDSCSMHSPLRLKRNQFYWCSSCKTRVSSEEAGAHASQGHKLYLGAYVEKDVREEIYDAF